MKQLNTLIARIVPAAGVFGIAVVSVRVTAACPVPVSAVSLKVRMNT
jgi:hypothetical protein